MAVELATAFISLTVSTKDLAPDVRKALGSSEVSNAATKQGKSIGGALFGAVAGVAATITSKAFSAVSDSVGAAISRVDIINNFPKIMQNLGYSSKAASASIATMSDKLTGLPTSLDAMAGVVQQLAPLTGGLAEATNLSLALNNAMLAGGKSTDIQANAMDQYTQMLAVGKVDMAAWRSLVTAMPGQMDQLSKSLLGANAKQTDLYEALKTGKVSFEQFNGAILKLNNKGLKGYASFSDQAKDATNGIATAQSNLGTAITRGLGKVIAVLQPQIVGALGFITDGINNVASVVAPAVNDLISGLTMDSATRDEFAGQMEGLVAVGATLRTVFENIGTAITGAFSWLQANRDWISALAVGILGIVVAVKAWTAATAVMSALQNAVKVGQIAYIALTQGQTAATNAAKVAQLGFNTSLLANPIFLIIAAIVALVAGLVWFFTQTKVGKEIWAGFTKFLTEAWDNTVKWITDAWNNTSKWLTAAFKNVSSFITSIWSGISRFFTDTWRNITTGVKVAILLVQSIVKSVTSTIRGIWEGAWRGIGNFFKGIWDGIVNAVKRFGGFFRDAFNGIKGFVQNAFKGVLGVVKGPINGLIGLINGAIRGLNSLSVTIPDWVPLVGGQTWGLNLPTIPQLAEGGIVRARSGGTIAQIGEGRYDEAVVPLSPEVLSHMGGGDTFILNANLTPERGRPLADQVFDAARRLRTRSGIAAPTLGATA